MYLHNVNSRVLKNILKDYHTHGPLVPRVYCNSDRRPHNALTFSDDERVVLFVVNYADTFGTQQSAAPRGKDNILPVFLPSSTTKKDMHHSYDLACTENGVRSLKISSFQEIWLQCCPHTKIARQEQDVCAKCEITRKEICDATTEDKKLESSVMLQLHILAVKRERENYKQTPRKIQIFGFRIDGLPLQKTQTIGLTGKDSIGPNSVISMVDFALQRYGYEKQHAEFHADNCAGQNKNRYVLVYFVWRVMKGLHESIKYMMQIPGHSRCLFDTGFAHLKRRYRTTDCDCLHHLKQVVDSSASTNQAVLYDEESGWQWRDLRTFLSDNFKPVAGIKRFQQFRMTREDPGIVFAKESGDEKEVRREILRSTANVTLDRPAVLHSPGLSVDRQIIYLRISARMCVDHTKI